MNHDKKPNERGATPVDAPAKDQPAEAKPGEEAF